MSCHNEKCDYFLLAYVGDSGPVPTCSKNKALEVFDCSTCKFNPDSVSEEIKDISKWAIDGFDLAEKMEDLLMI